MQKVSTFKVHLQKLSRNFLASKFIKLFIVFHWSSFGLWHEMISPPAHFISFLVAFMFLSLVFTRLDSTKPEPLSLPYDGYYFYVAYLVQCVQSFDKIWRTDMINVKKVLVVSFLTREKCKPQCGKYDNKTNPLCV